VPKLRVNSSHYVNDGGSDTLDPVPSAKVTFTLEGVNVMQNKTFITDATGRAGCEFETAFDQDYDFAGSSLKFSRIGYGSLLVSDPKKKYTLYSEGTDGQLESRWFPGKVQLWEKG
jgi:hypothetical protein